MIELQEEMIYDWINPIYLTSDVQTQIQERFENDSEIELLGFLKVRTIHSGGCCNCISLWGMPVVDV